MLETQYLHELAEDLGEDLAEIAERGMGLLGGFLSLSDFSPWWIHYLQAVIFISRTQPELKLHLNLRSNSFLISKYWMVRIQPSMNYGVQVIFVLSSFYPRFILPRNRHGIQLLEKKPKSIGEETWHKVVALLKQHVPASRDVTSSLTEINFSEAKRKRALKDGRESD